MDLEKASQRTWWQKWRIYILVAMTIVIIIVIVVPLAVILPQNHHHSTPAATVMLPLYIYPSNDSVWDPLYQALETNPDLNFTIIVNPDSGPGTNPYPGIEWADGMEKLNSYDNVRTVGYIPTQYASRNITEVLDAVSIYGGWSTNSTTMAVDGIFFDEAPYEYTSAKADYMRTINAAVKNQAGLLGDRMVIHNPGVIPDAGYNDTNLDVTVVFEGNYTLWQYRNVNVTQLPPHRGNYSVMINSIPTMDNSTFGQFVDGISKSAEYIFLTNSSQNFYESFSRDWLQFTDVMPVKN